MGLTNSVRISTTEDDCMTNSVRHLQESSRTEERMTRNVVRHMKTPVRHSTKYVRSSKIDEECVRMSTIHEEFVRISTNAVRISTTSLRT